MKRLLLGSFALLLAAPAAFPSGLFSFGVKGGVALNDAFNAASNGNINYVSDAKKWTVGPELDLNLPLGFAVEVDALYRRLGFASSRVAIEGIEQQATTANSWDFPVIAKWRFAPGPIRPYVGAGPTFRDVTNINQVTNFFGGTASGPASGPAAELNDNFVVGFTAVAGIQLIHHISPEIRYTRWGWDAFHNPSSAFRSNPDEWQFMVGLTF